MREKVYFDEDINKYSRLLTDQKCLSCNDNFHVAKYIALYTISFFIKHDI